MKVATPAGELRRMMARADRGQDASAEEAATGALRHAILQGDLKPGDRLRQEVLAAELGVSRIPLRDAFRRLEAEGLIQIDGRRGARVVTLSVDDVAELYELRRLLEVHCARLAIRNLTPATAAALIDSGERVDETPGHITPGGASRRGFYSEFYRAARRPRMAALILQVRHELNRYHTLKDVPIPDGTEVELRQRIRELDADGASRLIREHLRTSRDALIGVLRRDARARPRGAARERRSTPKP